MKKKISVNIKINAIVLVAILITATLNVLAVNSAISRSYGKLIEHYIGDIAFGYGEEVQVAVELQGEDAFTSDILINRLSKIAIQNMESSYAYMTSLDGTMLYHPTA